MEQEEEKRLNAKLLKAEVLKVIKTVFCEAYDTLKTRNIEEQNLLGNNITVIESEIKKRIKALEEQ